MTEPAMTQTPDGLTDRLAEGDAMSIEELTEKLVAVVRSVCEQPEDGIPTATINRWRTYLAEYDRARSDRVSPVEGAKGEELVTDGAGLIAIERERQISVEGWTPDHDAEYKCRELVEAAKSYLDSDVFAALYPEYIGAPPSNWPWDHKYWKPTPNDRVRELVKAGALIAAEIDRMRSERTKAALSATPAPSLDDRSAPVAYGIRTDTGGWFEEIAPVGWSTFDKLHSAMQRQPWVMSGKATIEPLYAAPPAGAVPKGWLLVPTIDLFEDDVNATDEQIDALMGAYLHAQAAWDDGRTRTHGFSEWCAQFSYAMKELAQSAEDSLSPSRAPGGEE